MTVVQAEPAAKQCAQLLLKLHALALRGEANSAEAATACEQMESPWLQMSRDLQQRLRGLSEDLYAIETGGISGKQMSSAEIELWRAQARKAVGLFEDGVMDVMLEFLRQPFPENVPGDAIPFMQAMCWQKLKEMDVAIVFMREAERLNRQNAAFLLTLLREEGHDEEALKLADQIIASSESTPQALYQAAGTLLKTLGETSVLRPPILERCASVLRRALSMEKGLILQSRELDGGEAAIAGMLGHVLEMLGQHRDAIRIYDETLLRYPRDAFLLTMRGVAIYQKDRRAALADFRNAVRVGATSVWPYLILANEEIRRGNYHAAWQLCLRGLERPAPALLYAQLHEWLGISRAMLRQPLDLVMESFDRALTLDPHKERIHHNRAIAERFSTEKSFAGGTWDIAEKADLRLARTTDSVLSKTRLGKFWSSTIRHTAFIETSRSAAE